MIVLCVLALFIFHCYVTIPWHILSHILLELVGDFSTGQVYAQSFHLLGTNQVSSMECLMYMDGHSFESFLKSYFVILM